MYSQRYALSLEVALQLPSDFFHLTRRCHLSATAYLLYHSASRLSTTFLFSFASFSEALCLSAVLAVSLYILPSVSQIVNTLFTVFYKKFFAVFTSAVRSPCNSRPLAHKPRSQGQKNIVFIQFFQECTLIYIGNNHSPRLSRTAKGNNVKRNPYNKKSLHQPR